MNSIRNFRKTNKINQVALAEYLQVTQGFISQMENETSAIPETIISRLLENPHGWDVSMLTKSPVVLPDPEPAPAAEVNMIDKLFALLEEKERNNALLLKILLDKEETIKHLTAEIAALKEKRETVANVG